MSAKVSTRIGHSIRWSLRIFTLLLITFATNTAAADQITLEIASADAGAAYHRIFLREQGQAYDYNNWVYQGSETFVTIDNLQAGVVYYFVARSYSDLFESHDSNEVTLTIPMEQAPLEPVHVWLEAEQGDVSDPMRVETGDADCSGDYIWAPSGSGNTASGDTAPGEAVYPFQVSVSGDYTVWGRVLAPSSADDSFWVSIDGGPYALWDTVQSSTWQWDTVSDRDAADPVIYNLSAGSHTLTIRHREDGTALDKLVITNDPSFVPEGLGEPLPVDPIDSDGDGISDQDEIDQYGTDPHNADSDGDGLNDGQELAYWGSQWNQDWDGDGLINLLDDDSDNDGILDGQELDQGSDPLSPDIPDSDPVHVWLEAEEGDVFDPMQIETGDADCSGDFIWTPNGVGNNWNATNASAGEVVYHFEVPVSGDYTIWGRVLTPTDNDDSFWVSVDGGPHALWDTAASEQWLWDAVNDRDGVDPAVYSLTAGSHTLSIKQREDGAALDKLMITNDPDFVPEGLGEPANDDPVHVWLEAEQGDVSDPMQVETGDADCSGDFVWTPNGVGNNWNATNASAGEVVYHFEVPVSGDYTIWGRVLTPTDNDDSFWVSVDGGPHALWDTAASEQWLWDAVNDRDDVDPAVYSLTAGSHTLSIKQREDGAALDKLVITNDPDFVPE